ncbi:MAG TPA: MmgE/PrpD family protein [Puia sp.]
MEKPYQSYQIADFSLNASFESIGPEIIEQLKRHLLDSVGSVIVAQKSTTIHKLAATLIHLSGDGSCPVPMLGKLPADRAAEWFTALIRYPDFMDNYIGKEATCHPSDNIGSLLAAGQNSETSGREFLLAAAIGYAIECRLVEETPVMIKGFDHTALLAYSLTASAGRLLGLSREQMAHAIGMAGSGFVPLVTSRAAYTYEWKGLASSMVALGCFNIIFMAREGLTGPLSIFEGPKGFEQIMDMKLKHEWTTSDFQLIKKCSLKSYNAEVHTQSSLEALTELRTNNELDITAIDSIDITTFLTAYHIVGGGVYGERNQVYSKEQADHSLPYVAAVAILDGQVYPEQLLPERINQPDVQALLQKVHVHTVSPLHRPLPVAGFLDPYTDAYPEKLKTKVSISTDKAKFICEKSDYHGFYTRPFSWGDTISKFKKLTDEIISADHQQQLVDLIQHFENHSVADLISLLGTGVNEMVY